MSRLSMNFREKATIQDSGAAVVADISTLATRGIEMNPNERHNGFDCRPSAPQVAVIIYYIVTNAVFGIILYPNLMDLAATHVRGTLIFTLSTVVCIPFVVCSALTLFLAYDVTAACPTDPLVRQQRMFKKHKLEFNSEADGSRDTKDDMHCNVCNLTVQGRTKHCAPCNRCCSEFDHHCVWLNNCIGARNYGNFRRLIFWFLLFNLLSLALVATAAGFGLLGSESSKIATPLKYLVYVQALFAAVVSLFDLQLILFHAWLVSKSITTFEYVHY